MQRWQVAPIRYSEAGHFSQSAQPLCLFERPQWTPHLFRWTVPRTRYSATRKESGALSRLKQKMLHDSVEVRNGKCSWPSNRLEELMLKVLLFLPWLRGFASGTSSFLDCDWDEDWRRFRLKLRENADRGYPEDAELESQASALLQKNWHELQPDENAIYGMSLAMQRFFLSCNTEPGSVPELNEPSCLYGVVSAMWVCARHGQRALLGHAKFLLGDVFRLALDFMEGSNWPLTSIDILANEAATKGFRLPPELRRNYEATEPRLQGLPPEPSFVVWEIGVHASLSAEPLQMWARILPVTLRHRNLIRDQYPQWLPKKCETLYGHPKLQCDDVEDDITQLFRLWIPNSATSKDPVSDMTSLATEFQRRFVAKREKVDLFLCTIAYLCLVWKG